MSQLTKQETQALSKHRIEKIKDTSQTILDNLEADNTKLAYKKDFNHLLDFCSDFNLDISLLTASDFRAFIADQLSRGFAHSTLKRRLVGINKKLLKEYGYNFKGNEEVKEFMRGAARTLNRASDTKQSSKEKAKPITPEEIIKAVEFIDSQSKISKYEKLRDKTMILLCYAGMFRRSELTALKVDNLNFTSNSVEISLYKSKSNQTGKQEIKVIKKSKTVQMCPVRSLQTLINENNLKDYIFQSITRGKKKTGKKISDVSFYKIIKKYLGSNASPHGLRAGSITTAFMNGHSVTEIQSVSLQKDAKTTIGYGEIAEKNKVNLDLGI